MVVPEDKKKKMDNPAPLHFMEASTEEDTGTPLHQSAPPAQTALPAPRCDAAPPRPLALAIPSPPAPAPREGEVFQMRSDQPPHNLVPGVFMRAFSDAGSHSPDGSVHPERENTSIMHRLCNHLALIPGKPFPYARVVAVHHFFDPLNLSHRPLPRRWRKCFLLPFLAERLGATFQCVITRAGLSAWARGAPAGRTQPPTTLTLCGPSLQGPRAHIARGHAAAAGGQRRGLRAAQHPGVRGCGGHGDPRHVLRGAVRELFLLPRLR